MNSFLIIPQVIINNEEQEKTVNTRIRPDEICNYYPGFYWGTVINLKSRGAILCRLSVEEIDKALEAYYNASEVRDFDFAILTIGKVRNSDFAALSITSKTETNGSD